MPRHGGFTCQGEESDCREGSVEHNHRISAFLTDTLSSVKRYLGWISIKAEVFNVGKYRRQATPHPDAKFFDMNNPDGEKARRAAAEAAVNDMLAWFEDRTHTVAILDATNSTKSRRLWIYDRVRAAGIIRMSSSNS